MKKQRIIGILTIIAGLSGLGGFWLIGQLDKFPTPAKVIVVNSIFFRGICGTLGGILIWRGNRWGYYLTLICWLYLIVVSVLTLVQLHDNGLVVSYEFLEQNYSSFGRPFLISAIKIIAGVPIVHIVIKNLLATHKYK